jgi:hypothetical protein
VERLVEDGHLELRRPARKIRLSKGHRRDELDSNYRTTEAERRLQLQWKMEKNQNGWRRGKTDLILSWQRVRRKFEIDPPGMHERASAGYRRAACGWKTGGKDGGKCRKLPTLSQRAGRGKENGRLECGLHNSGLLVGLRQLVDGNLDERRDKRVRNGGA